MYLIKEFNSWSTAKKVSIVFLLLLLVTNPVFAESAVSISNTAPPPEEYSTYGAFNPKHKYLDDGYSIIQNKGKGKIEISGITKEIGYIDTLGVQMILQKWTGTVWVDHYTSASYSDNDIAVLENTVTRTIETGYYYRIKSTHWAEQDNIMETGVVTGSSFLIN